MNDADGVKGKETDMNNFKEAVKAFMNTLASESSGGGTENLEPQRVAAVALFLEDGRVALFGGGRE